jgi:Flp pilus assembly protein TadB
MVAGQGSQEEHLKNERTLDFQEVGDSVAGSPKIPKHPQPEESKSQVQDTQMVGLLSVCYVIAAVIARMLCCSLLHVCCAAIIVIVHIVMMAPFACCILIAVVTGGIDQYEIRGVLRKRHITDFSRSLGLLKDVVLYYVMPRDVIK